MKPLADCFLYTFIDTGYVRPSEAVDIARQLCDGGSDLIQLRAKGASVEEVQRLAERIAPVLTAADVGLVINDHPQVAAAIGAPLCHLGQEDFFNAGLSHVKQIWEQHPDTYKGQIGVGLSSHAPDQARRAVSAGADYIAVGPVFPTATKPGAHPVGFSYVQWASSSIRIPWFAIGGITLQNLAEVIQAGARRVCVVSAILKAPNVVRACQQFKDRLLSAGR
jgi:thiamine-phosphate pyrophosphorylase